MKHVPLVLAFLALAPAPAAPACNKLNIPNLMVHCCDAPVVWAARHDTQAARIAITTTDGDAVVLLTKDVLAIQLSDHFMHKVKREFKAEEDADEDNAFSQAVKTIVLTTVNSVISHSAECSLRDVGDVDYRNGSLVITTEDGDRLFDDLAVEDRVVLDSFDERDARAFVREFHRLKGHSL